MVGGYAVSALTEHRFSVDCDIVVSEKELGSFEKVLTAEGYKKVKATSLAKRIHGAKTAKYVKLIGGRRVAVDLYANSVVSRDTGGKWSYSQLLKNSVDANVVGITDSTIARVPRRELLIAMKLHAARDTDMRDVVMLGEEADWNTVAEFARTGTRNKLKAQLDSAIKKIGSKEFPWSLKAEFGLRTDVTPITTGILNHLRSMKRQLAEKANRT